MADTDTLKQPQILAKIKGKFKTDFLKYSLLTVWLITIIFLLFFNLFIFSSDAYAGQSKAFEMFDRTKVYLEIVLSLSIILSAVLIFFKRSLARTIGFVTSGIIIYMSIFFIVLIMVSNSVIGKTTDNPFYERDVWYLVRYWVLVILHIFSFVLIAIDLKRSRKVETDDDGTLSRAEKKAEKKKKKEEEKRLKQLKKEEAKSKDNSKETDNSEEESEGNQSDESVSDEAKETTSSSLSSEDLKDLDELSKLDVKDEDKEKEQEELENLTEEDEKENI